MSVLIQFITTKLWLSLIPALLVAVGCGVLIVKRRKERSPVWFGALVTLPVMIGKLLLVWTIEPIMVLIPPIGYVLRAITALALVPEGLVFIRFLEPHSRSGEPWLVAASLTIPFGSILLGAVAALVYKKIRDEK